MATNNSANSANSAPSIERAAYIPDGFTLRGYIAAQPRLHGAVRFTYRPTRKAERMKLLESTRDGAYVENAKQCAAALARHLVSWDIVDHVGVAVPISAAVLLDSISPEVVDRLTNVVVWANEPTDVDPEWSADDERAAREPEGEQEKN